ncbi:GTP diphosphokinase [Kangiella koreensis]|uniref:GTP pyrophosphokinase n=1 Tax=Kangiella koreensis (strain DSM 16069 / JCM 12317 / KCTC 12182 / SW-125) TaxID=523791 RepID=C7RAH3_KANKD|nr:GTP diphosphokinase [Kangiella koreensis]ACV26265.1 (p)ppGpp synthetase I, SpoT/RelA [Kangiella koreensis DSM 16069]
MKRKDHDIFELVESSQFSFEQWLELNQLTLDGKPKSKMAKAVTMAEQNVSVTPVLKLNTLAAGLELAEVLTHFNADPDTLTAAILLPSVIAGSVKIETIKDKVGSTIAGLVEGAGQMEAMRSLQQETGAENDQQQVESLRKMLLGMVNDARVVLLKLADRVVSLRHIKDTNRETQLTFARETKNIFAPLANRLGIGQLKWELEDLSFRYLEPEAYLSIAKNLKEKRVDRERYIDDVTQLLEEKLKEENIKGEVSGRVKHIYSIWKKMTRKKVGFEEIYDVRAVRILVERVQDCYGALGIVHGEWQHIPKEFDDYVATPKENGYRSIHTAVVGPEGKILEIQIRTFQMHEESEKGIAAHWAYKEGANLAKVGVDDKIAWMRQLLEWQSELADVNADELMHEFQSSVSEDRVFVFTPQGKVIDLPAGSTPIDFAYRIHSSIGHRCVGAKINGRIVPLTYQVQTGEVIDIMTQKEESPSRDWLIPHNGYINSSRTRHKIQQFFNKLDQEDNANAGRLLLEKELARNHLANVPHQELAQKLHLASDVEMYTKIGTGNMGITQAINRAKELLEAKQPQRDIKPVLRKKSKRKSFSDVSVSGVGDLLTSIAKCCKPVPGEDIIGYVTQGRGIVIHLKDCTHAKKALRDKPERIIPVQWEAESTNAYAVDLVITAMDRKSLLKDITTILANENAGVTDLSTSKRGEQVQINIEVELSQLEDLQRVITLLKQLPNIFKVERRRG